MHHSDLDQEAPVPTSTAASPREAPSPTFDMPEAGSDAEVLAAAADYYHRTLRVELSDPAEAATSLSARHRLELRALADSATLTHFGVGVSDRSLGRHIPAATRKRGAAIRERLIDLGLYRSNGREHLRGRLTVPIHDEAGRVVDIYGRSVNDDRRRPNHLFLGETPAFPLFHVAALHGAKEVIVAGSVFDAMTLWRFGLRQVVGLFGAGTFTDEHCALFRKHQVERVFLAFRRDKAGQQATTRAAEMLEEAGLEVFGVQLPRGLDLNAYAIELLRTGEPPADALRERVRNAQWMVAGEPSVAPWALFGAPIDNEVPAARGEEAPPVEALARQAVVVEAEDDAAVPPPSLVTPHVTPPSAPPPKPASPPTSSPPETTASPPTTSGPRLVVDNTAAGAAPPPPAYDAEADELTLRIGDRHWRVRGLATGSTPHSLKVNVLVARSGAGFHIDNLDLYLARARKAYIKEAAAELRVQDAVVKRDIGKVLLQAEQVQHEQLTQDEDPRRVPEMSEAERDEALSLLRDPALLDRVVDDLDRCGIVGERTNKLVAYLAMTSRLLQSPLAVAVRSTSAAGKSTVVEGVLDLIPPEDRFNYSAITGQSLYYVGADALKHSVLSIAEEQGARRAGYALKLLQSEGRLTIASTGKDSAGRMRTEPYSVEGPIALVFTTTSIDIDEELLNRCIVLTVDEGREQTRRIQERQRQAQTLDGILAQRERAQLRRLHQNAQRLLGPVEVVNPFAEQLRFVDHRTRTRRDHAKYLGLIRAIALLHQHQRTIHTVERGGTSLRYMEVEASDVRLANQLCDEVLGRSLDDLGPQTRALLVELSAMVEARTEAEGLHRAEVRFTRRSVREWTQRSPTQVGLHLHRLVELEYVICHAGGRGRTHVYELAWDGRGSDGAPCLDGLIDPEDPAP